MYINGINQTDAPVVLPLRICLLTLLLWYFIFHIRYFSCLLDGFPRTVEQAQVLAAEGQVHCLIYIDVPNKTLQERAPNRRIDLQTGKIYSTTYIPPPSKIPESRLSRRRYDDDPKMFQVRLEAFRYNMRRILPYFSGAAYKVNGMQDPKQVHSSICDALEKSVQAVSSANTSASAQAQGGECIICFDAPADYLVTPCGHQCGCKDCLTVVKNTSGKCPICRATINTIQQVFNVGKAGKNDDKTGASRPPRYQPPPLEV